MKGIRRNVQFGVAAIIAAVLIVGAPDTVLATSYTWASAVNGVFNDSGKWNPAGVPGSTDSVTFNEIGTYTVTFTTASTINDDCTITQGNVTLTSSGGTRTYSLAGTGGENNANVNGGTLTLGTSGNSLCVAAGNLYVQTGGTLDIYYGSQVSASNSISIGAAPGDPAAVVVDGSNGSSLTGSTGTHTIGSNGSTGTLTFQKGASGSIAGTTVVGDSTGSGGTGTLRVASGASLRLGDLQVVPYPSPGSSGSVIVTGASSTITQSGASTLTLGADADSTASLTISSSASPGGAFTSGTGLTTINRTGRITVNDGGKFNANGSITIDGGVLEASYGSNFKWAASNTMTIQNGGQVTVHHGYTLPISSSVNISSNGSTSQMQCVDGWLEANYGSQINVQSGGALTVAALHVAYSNIDLESAVVVDGSGASFAVTASNMWNSVGSSSSTGSLTLRNGASGTIAGPMWVGVPYLAGNGRGTVAVESGATLTMADLSVGTDASVVTGLVTVNGSGSSITQAGASTLTLGATANSTATLSVRNGGAYTTPNTILNPTGTILIDGGGMANFGNLTQYGGTVSLVRGSLTYIGDFRAGMGGLFGNDDVTLANGQLLTLSGTTTVDPFWTFKLAGGGLNTGSLDVRPIGTFGFVGGTLGITGSAGLLIGSGGPLGTSFTLSSGCNLNVTSSTMINSGAILTVNGGQMTSGAISNSGTVSFQSGGLSVSGTITNQPTGQLVIGNLGSLDTPAALVNLGWVELQGGMARLGGAGALSNSGVITGIGRIAKDTSNTAAGQINADKGNHLVFSGSNGINAGLINLTDATVEFTNPLTNGASGVITSARGALKIGGTGLTNLGNVGFSAGASEVYGKLNNMPAAKVITSGGGTTTFWDDVVNDGTIQTSVNCNTVFLGPYSGTGSHTGPGTVYFEDDLSPGHSPAAKSTSPTRRG